MRKSLLAVLVFTLVACGGDKATGPQNVTGNYTLRTVNGINVPGIVYQDAVEKDEVTDGSVNIAANNNWTGTLGIRTTDLVRNQVSAFPGIPIAGTYTLTGNTLTLNDPNDQLTFTGTVTNGTLTFTVDLGVGTLTTLVYSK